MGRYSEKEKSADRGGVYFDWDFHSRQGYSFLDKVGTLTKITRSVHNFSTTILFTFINVLSSKPRTHSFSIPLHFSFPVKALIDTGAFSSAMPLSIFNKIKRICPKSITN